jgi:hypothetical protein
LARGSSLFATVVRALPKDDGGGQPWRLDLWRGADGRDALVLNWFHPLADARAATRLLRWLGQECRDDELRAPPAEKRFGSADRLVEALEPAERNALSEGYIEHVEQLGERPILSLYTAAGRPRAQGMVAHRLLLSPEQTRTFDRSVRRRARLADTSLVVYAAARMLDRLMAVRGYSPTQQLISVPLSLDPKAGCERMFGNHLTMMMLSLDRDDLADEARAVTTIAAQRRAIVRQKLDLGMLAALHRARVLPGAIYQWVSRRPFDGELASLVVSSPGALDLDTFFGVEVSDVMCVPLITPQPGSMVVATRHRGRLSLVVEHMAPLVSAAEARDALGAFEADLLGHGHADVEM